MAIRIYRPTSLSSAKHGLTFYSQSSTSSQQSQTYHTDEVDAQEDLARGLQGTAAGFPTVELPSTASQHKEPANDGNCA